MHTYTIQRVVYAAVTALSVGFLAKIILTPFEAKAQDVTPPGFAEAQRDALWRAIRKSPKLTGVDMITVIGPGTGPVLEGWLSKFVEVDGKWIRGEKKFWARIDRTCEGDASECLRCVGVWSGADLLAHMGQ